MKFKIYKFNSVTSTNDEAIRLIREKRKIFGCVYADTQTKGRGTHRNKWISKKGNLFSSLFFPLKEIYPTTEEFTAINPVIVSDTIKKFCHIGKISLKFPNDIFLNGKKICGLLQEVITLENKKYLIIGIGINVISNPKINNKYEATNILLETKKKPIIIEIIKSIISSYEKFFLKLNIYNYKKYVNKVQSISFN